MYCNRCGQSLESTDAFCTRCGQANPGAAQSGPEYTDRSDFGGQQGTAYTRPDYQPGQTVRPTGAAPLTEQGPSVTSQVVLAIVNMLTFGFGISAILGVVALVFALLASGAADPTEARSKLQSAKTLNLIGLAIAVLQFLVIIAVVVGLFGALFAGLSR
jgi:hypothetical protein